MIAAALVADLAGRGVTLRADGDTLRWCAPVGVLTATDAGVLRARKVELLMHLRVESLERDYTAHLLRARYDELTADERARLRAEAAAGDRLAVLIMACMARA